MRLHRRCAVLVLLALLTLVVQQGAWLHGLSHGAESRLVQVGDAGDGLPAPVCEECLAYAAVGAALATAGLAHVQVDDLPLPPVALPARLLPPGAEPYRARAPPLPV